MTDYGAAVILPHLTAICERQAPGVSIEVITWHERSYEDLSAAKIDLLFSQLSVPQAFCIQPLFQDHFVCLRQALLLRRNVPYPRALYGMSAHLSVETEQNQQNLIDRTLAE